MRPALTAVDAQAWIRCFHPAAAAPVRLVCFPHAGGSASFYYPLSAALQSQAEVLCVQYPGRQERRREPFVRDIGTMADHITRALQPWCDQPLAFFGHSMGAVVSFEVARRLQQTTGVVPMHLFASGRRAPSTRRDERIHEQEDEILLAEIKALDGTQAELLADEELLRMVLPVIRSDYQAIETYQCEPGPKLACPVTVLVGDSDPKVTADEARAWAEHTLGVCEIRSFHGGHFYLTDCLGQIVPLLSERLRA